MKIGVRTQNGDERRLIQARQIGAHGGSIWAPDIPGFQESCVLTLEDVLLMRDRFETHDLLLTGIGLGADCLKNQLLGLPARDREIDRVCQTIRIIGEVYKDKSASESPVIILDQRVTYWARDGWRGAARVPGRGGAPAGKVSLDEVWERIAYLYERIVPVAEEADIRLATHPDDPPLPVYRGAHQALSSFAGFRRLFELFPSAHNGMLLCLGCMQEAGEDPIEVIRYFGKRDRVFYVHFRNVKGTVPHYTEVFPDQGDLDMVAAMRALWEVGYGGVLVPDHHFGILGDDEWSLVSRAWQVGYVTALIQATSP